MCQCTEPLAHSHIGATRGPWALEEASLVRVHFLSPSLGPPSLSLPLHFSDPILPFPLSPSLSPFPSSLNSQLENYF